MLLLGLIWGFGQLRCLDLGIWDVVARVNLGIWATALLGFGTLLRGLIWGFGQLGLIVRGSEFGVCRRPSAFMPFGRHAICFFTCE